MKLLLHNFCFRKRFCNEAELVSHDTIGIINIICIIEIFNTDTDMKDFPGYHITTTQNSWFIRSLNRKQWDSNLGNQKAILFW